MRDVDDEEDFGRTYRRPSLSAWVAALSFAVTVFMVGGYVYAYKYLKQVTAESRQEIRELRQALQALQKQAMSGRAAAGSGESSRQGRETKVALAGAKNAVSARSGLASVSRDRDSAAQASPELASQSLAFEPAAAGASLQEFDSDAEDQDDKPLFSTASGLSAFIPKEKKSKAGLSAIRLEPAPIPASLQAQAVPREDLSRIKVIAVNTGMKKIMVEGGRDRGIAEGKRLELSRSGRWIGDLRVVAVFDNISACEVLHCTMTPEPGDLVRLPDAPAS